MMHLTKFERWPDRDRRASFMIECLVSGRDREYFENLWREWGRGGARSEGMKFSLSHDVLARCSTKVLKQEIERRVRLRLSGKTTSTD